MAAERKIVAVREPLVLVSQIQRSGGTLLSQLFDGHPEVHAHPSEIYIGHPKKWDWPQLDLSAPATWFDLLCEAPAVKHSEGGGYKKGKQTDDVFAFDFSVELQREIFERCVAELPQARERDVLDCYFTSYFNAWRDNANLSTGPKKTVTGFTPRLAMSPGNVEAFFSAYPDGRLISIVRDPRGWYASASRHKSRYRDVDTAIALWRLSAESAFAAAERFGDRVTILTYEELVRDTDATMRRIADRIGITFSGELLEPSFNGQPTRSNSVEKTERRYGVSTERAEAFRSTLDPAVIARIDELAGDLYARVP